MERWQFSAMWFVWAFIHLVLFGVGVAIVGYGFYRIAEGLYGLSRLVAPW